MILLSILDWSTDGLWLSALQTCDRSNLEWTMSLQHKQMNCRICVSIVRMKPVTIALSSFEGPDDPGKIQESTSGGGNNASAKQWRYCGSTLMVRPDFEQEMMSWARVPDE